MRLAEPIVDMALAFIVFGVLVGRWLACRGRLLTDLRARKPTPLGGGMKASRFLILNDDEKNGIM